VLAETVKRIEEMADKKGISRNALIAQLLAKATAPRAKKEEKVMAIKIKTATSFYVPPHDVHTLVAILHSHGFVEVDHTVQHVARRWKMGTAYVNLFHTGSVTVQDDYKSIAYRQVIHSLREAAHES
ncbi:MAG: hypothetical protein EBR82_56585, partial [Caulobacteraceae bacterium]|nr:hypothetical protein [Caulobacteraceae bacterium]